MPQPLCAGGDVPPVWQTQRSGVLLPGALGTEPCVPGDYSLSALIFLKASFSFYFQEKHGRKFLSFDSAPKTDASIRDLFLKLVQITADEITFAEVLEEMMPYPGKPLQGCPVPRDTKPPECPWGHVRGSRSLENVGAGMGRGCLENQVAWLWCCHPPNEGQEELWVGAQNCSWRY